MLGSLKYHKCAISLAESDKLDKALDIMSKCSVLAKKMANESEELANKADELVKIAFEALSEANNDQTICIQEQK